MVTLARRASRIPFAPVVAVLFGIVAGILMAAVPQWLFERGVVASGLPAIIAAAAPPLGLLARLLAITGAFLAMTVLLWAVLGPITAKIEGRARARTPWRDAGYDVPLAEDSDLFVTPRRPIFAPEELGAPLMSDDVLELQPESVVTPSSEESVRFEPPPEPLVSPAIDSSIAALILRLEEGLARRAARTPDPDQPTDTPDSEPLDLSEIADAIDSPAADEGDDKTIRQAMGMFRKLGHA